MIDDDDDDDNDNFLKVELLTLWSLEFFVWTY